MFVQTSNDKGAVAELKIAAAAIDLGVVAFWPVSQHARADLALDIGGCLWRVQCKWGRLSIDRDVVVVSLAGSRLTPSGYLRSPYTADEIDFFGVYCGELDRSFLVPVARAAGMHQLHLRLVPPRNGQRACITLADDFDFEGAIAQLGERRHGMAEVVGSSPTSSTPVAGPPTIVGSNRFRDHFGDWMDRAAAGEQVLVTRRGRPLVRLSPAATRFSD
jgi:prevent-host-death family protein